MYIGTAIGITIGLYLFKIIDASILTPFLGLALLSYTAFALLHPTFYISKCFEKILMVPVGMLTGIVNGCTGTQFVPGIPYLLSLRLNVNEFLQASNIFFTLASVMMIIGLSKLNFLTFEIAMISIAGAIPVIIGVKLGSKIRDKLPVEAFKTGVLIVLSVAGISFIVRSFLTL